MQMSDLLLLRSSLVILLLFGFIQLSSSFEVEAKPSSLYFSGNIDKKECKTIEVFSDSRDVAVS